MNGPIELVDMRWADCGQVQQGGWSVAWAQIIGVHHPSLSEDSVAHRMTELTPNGCALTLAVADGVGGGARGDVASSVLADHCAKALPDLMGNAEGLASWMRKAESKVQLKLREVSLSPGAATLAAAWLMPDGNGHLMRVGDARVYLYGKVSHGTKPEPPTLISVTSDQTYAYVHETPPQGGCLDDPARMIGTGFMGELEIATLHVAADQTLLLCSDGLHRGLGAVQIGQILSEANDLSEAASQLAGAARQHGSRDDISVLLAQRNSGNAKTASSDCFSGLRQWWASTISRH